MLWRPPGIKDRNLMHAGNRAMRRARFLGEIFAADVLYGVLLKRNRWVATLLRAVVHQSVFADVEISRTCAAAPRVRTAQSYIVLERIDTREAALLEIFHLVIDASLFISQRL